MLFAIFENAKRICCKHMEEKYMKRAIITLVVVIISMLGLANVAAADEYYQYGDVEYRISGYRAYVHKLNDGVTSFTIPKQIYNIGYYDVVGIDANAFSGTDITNLSMWGSITTINETFLNCSKLTKIVVDKSNNIFSSDSYGCLYNKNKTELLCVPRAKTGSYTMPASVTMVNSNAISNANKLTSITINNNIQELEIITSPNTLTQILTLADNPYYTSVDGVLYSKDMKTIARYPEGKEGTSYQVADGVTTIGESAFYGCKLISVNLPDSVNTIKNYAFQYCSALEKMYLGNIKKIGHKAFYDCDMLNFVSFSGLLESMEWYAFAYCESLENIAFYGPVQFGSNVFEGCKGLLDADLTYIETVSSSMFTGCTALKSITFSGKLKEIGASAFRGCTSLVNIQLPEGLDAIQNSAFSGCTSLNNVVIPDSVTVFGTQVFYNTTTASPETITVGDCTYLPTRTNDYGILFSVASTATSISVNSKTKVIAGDAAENCTSLVSVALPEGITSIGNYSFSGCAALKNVNIPESVKTIGSYAFSGTSIESVNIPDCVTSVGTYAYNNCKKIKTATLGDGLTAMPEYMFYSCSSLESVRLGKNIKKIGGWSFNRCTALSKINFPDGLTDIGTSVFSYCVNLRSIELPDTLERIGGSAFGGCANLETIRFGNSSPTIASSAFFVDGGTNAKVYIESIEAWCNTTFAWASSNPAGVGSELYLNNKLITDLVIPETVTEIKNYAFQELEHIKTVTLHKSLKTIGRYVFSGCTNINKVYYSGTEKDWADIEFGDSNAPILNSERVYIRPVIVKNKQGEEVGKEYFVVDSAADLSKISIDMKGYKPIYYTDSECTVPCVEMPVVNDDMVIYADFVKYCTESEIDGTVVRVDVYGLPNGCDIAVAMYDKEGLLNTKVSQYNGEELKVDLAEGSTLVKIMAFEQIETLEPLCDAECIEV